MKARKILVSIAALALVAAISIAGTLAYLTDKANVTNTFTVGNIHIKLDEAVVGPDGKATDKENNRTTETNNKNSYNLMPNHVYDKDPTVTVLADSEESYIRMLVTVTFDKLLTDDANIDLGTLDKIFTGYDASRWSRYSVTSDTATDEKDATHKYTVMTFEYRYCTTVNTKDGKDKALEPLFTKVEIPSTWGNEQLNAIGGFTIDIVAQAIQADGFVQTTAADGTPISAVDNAWNAFGK